MTSPTIGFDRPQPPRHARRGTGVALLAVSLLSAPACHGLEFSATYTMDLLSNRSGGLETGTRHLDNLDLEFGLDLGERIGAGKNSLFVHALYNNGVRFSEELVGDLQVVSNIDADHALRVFEAWYETGGERWSVKTGLYDLNSEFDVNETGGLFLNSSHGIGAEIGQTGRNGPGIFPVSSLAVRGEFVAGRGKMRLVVMDGEPGDSADPGSNEIDLGGDEGFLAVVEFDTPLSGSSRLWAGYWSYSADFDRPWGEGRSDGNAGWYLGAEHAFALGGRRAAYFVRYGRANPELNAIEDYLGAGLVIDAPFAGREDDQLGLAVASAGLGDPYRESIEATGDATRGRETVWELSYRARAGRHVVVQPDIQYVQNPSGLAAVDDALVLGIRFELAY